MQTVEKTTAAVARRLDGKVAIVTGAASGIGAAICARFVEEGASVVAVDVKAEALEHYQGEEQVAAFTGDVTRAADVDAMVRTAIDRFGKLDVLVNNAGIMDGFMPVAEVTDEMWNRVLAVNLTGPMMLSRAVVKHLLESGGGTIVNLASVGGLFGSRAGVAYTASKHGVIGLTKNTAAVYAADGIRCNAICPGGVNTGMPLGGDPSPKGYKALEKTLGAMPGVADPAQLAAVAAFLASDDSSFMNGAIVVADGGWTVA